MATNPNMEAIETVTVSATSAANITFSNIPQTYTDLVLVLSGRTTQSSLADSVYFTFNSSTSNFSSRVIYNDGSSASMFTQARYAGSQPGSTATTSTFSNIEIYIPGYTNNRNKSYLVDSVSENNSTTGYIYSAAGLWSNTSAINSIVLTPNAGSFVQHSTATLYGVTSAGYGAKATGGIITSDADYVYHTFYSSGTFTPTVNLTADYLVVAGGGASGSQAASSLAAAGGGAGGYRTSIGGSPLSLTASTAYTVTIGAGGSGGAVDNESGAGNNSVFSTITSSGGGRGASRFNNSAEVANGGSGGSGGGGRGGNTGGGLAPGSGGAGNSGSYSPVEGYAGGAGYDSSPTNIRSGGGGGGAGEAGNTDGQSEGGDGVSNSITGTATFYAGGGGGGQGNPGTGWSGLGGQGGGGNGGTANTGSTGSAGTANTGGGGGAPGAQGDPGKPGTNGGSGIVIVRYEK